MRLFARFVALPALMALVGCQRQAPVNYSLRPEVQELSKEVQQQIVEQLEKHCGTPTRPKLLGQTGSDVRHLARGAELYRQRCAACHGVTGDGAGLAAQYMYPKPRDYRRGIFKFTSTENGVKPLRADLMRTIRNGAVGTSMPAFGLLPEEDLNAILDYVMVLTYRGELEIQLALEAANEDKVDPEVVPGLVQVVLQPWQEAHTKIVRPLTAEPPMTPESIEIGKKAFLSDIAGCFKCHGDDGRGLTTENLKGFVDVWQNQTRAADLSSGMFHGGSTPEDLYRRIYAGVTGSPMPAFNLKLADQPETFWHLVHYVQHISGARRRSVMASFPANRLAQREAGTAEAKNE